MNELEVKNEIKQIIIEATGLSQMKPEEIKDDMTIFGEGLGLDSIDVLEVVVELEKKFNLKIRNDESGKKVLQNVNTIYGALQEI